MGVMYLRRLTIILGNRSRPYSSAVAKSEEDVHHVLINGREFQRDKWTNVTPKILSHLGRNLHLQKCHPLSLLKQRIVNLFYKKFVGRTGNPIFSVYDNLDPVVTVAQNFDSLLIPQDHPSRLKSDCYYINHDYLLRAHTTAHQSELIGMGLNNFLIAGDVFRRDEIDSSHYPVFHQVDAVRLCSKHDVFRSFDNGDNMAVFEKGGVRTAEKQESHTVEASKIMEDEVKSTLVALAQNLFGQEVKYRWLDAYFPFTHPSWELEVLYRDNWMELLGCGVMEQKIVDNAGAHDRIGWAFGLGLERLAMCLYDIPDIRLFWSTDTGFLSQFDNKDPNDSIRYKLTSVYPQCINDISFWLPKDSSYSSNDFYDLVRDIGGDIVEQISLVDNFTHPKKQQTSHCYRIVYRHMEKTLTQEEVNVIHKRIEQEAAQKLNVEIR
ncbi:probable phenylalanine--tRNA ligase, mitochondrial isoform X1 [Periplaneta americana]|uniref:probable phenylalanine--tRNA ligase, mitochondrial isoform X1 n=1 Tax=Periplaneta americana TaxID=6978 RepID=UPI0037E9C0E7